MKIVELLSGKKTYLIAVAGIIWGLYNHDYTVVFTAIGLMGLRNGLTSEVKKLAQPEVKTPVEQAQPEAVLEAPIDPSTVLPDQTYG